MSSLKWHRRLDHSVKVVFLYSLIQIHLMFKKDEFRNYAIKHQGISSLHLDSYVESSMTPYIIEERQLNVAQMDVFSRLMMDRIIFPGYRYK